MVHINVYPISYYAFLLFPNRKGKNTMKSVKYAPKDIWLLHLKALNFREVTADSNSKV